MALGSGGQRLKVALTSSLPYCWGHIAPLRSGAMRKLVFKEGRLLLTRTHQRFSRSPAVARLSDPRISLSGDLELPRL